MAKKKIEAVYYEKKKGASKYNPWGLKHKKKLFTTKKAAISFAKKKGKKNIMVSLAFE